MRSKLLLVAIAGLALVACSPSPQPQVAQNVPITYAQPTQQVSQAPQAPVVYQQAPAPVQDNTVRDLALGAVGGYLLGSAGSNRGGGSAGSTNSTTVVNRTVVNKTVIVQQPRPTPKPRYSAPARSNSSSGGRRK